MRSASSWKITIRLFFDLCKVPVSQAHNGLSARAGPTARSPVGHGRASLGGPRLSRRQIAGIPTSTAGPRTPGQAKDSLTITGGLGHHPLLAVCDNTGGEPLAWMLRRGSAGSNTAADHLQLLDAAIAAIPPG